VNRARIHLIAAARPNMMKVAPLFHALRDTEWCEPVLVHTGQHYDQNMSGAFLDELGLPDPAVALGVGAGTHAEQTAGVMVAYERVCLDARPDWVIVVGDVNSTMACTIAAKKLGIPVAHLEAGLRSGDRTMPEEINRIVTDSIADLHWTPSPDGDANLRREGIAESSIVRVGNIMIDSYEMLREKIEANDAPGRAGLESGKYIVATIHRPANVDRRDQLQAVVDALHATASTCPVVFPVHPRTLKRLEEFGLWSSLAANGAIRLVQPMSYIEFMSMVRGARAVVTDSGGVQEETTYLDIPCLTLRDTTERPITVTQGSNRLVRIESLAADLGEVMSGAWPHSSRPDLWDGHTAARVVASLRSNIDAR
jgi:UDP-N-acetylglucosamine 2-epimerase (non-hydrolysing)